MTQFDILNEVKRRTAEAVIAQSGLSHDALRRHLRELLAGDDPAAGAMLQQPVLEGAHPFVTADETMAALAGSVLHADLVAALDRLGVDHEYRFPLGRKPFRHQAEAWRLLADRNPQSVLVTSGTGSGKTECFLFPILSDLAAQVQGQREPLEGVQAIMLYPLNALIESQRERLSAWTRPFGGRLRYCLYNGDLPRETRESERRRTPEQVIDREQLWASPPPVLVTNVTMLEYMLVRTEDRPLIDKPSGKLKWIVLDEAHSLVGAAAAEIALLLRRVMLAFGVKPDQVRFVATSATIGSGDNVRQQLQRFLADIAGIPDAQVHVIEGRRQMPRRPDGAPPSSCSDIRGADPGRLYDMLGRDPQVWRLVERLFDGGVPLADFEKPARTYGVSASDLVFAMARAARATTDAGEERLAPVRLHAFERAVPGIWSCVNPQCTDKPPGWTFGGILHERADNCPACSAPVLEIINCNECGEAYLEGAESSARLSAPVRKPPRDEFAFDRARDDDAGGEGEEDGPEQQDTAPLDRLFAANPTSYARRFYLDRRAGWRVVDEVAADGVELRSEEHAGPQDCPHCRQQRRRSGELRPLRFGAPFILGNAAPILLEGVDPAPSGLGVRLPSAGRRLLSFTDSRQGTARMAAKLQIDAERNFVRSFIYHQMQASMLPPPDADQRIADLQRDIVQFEEAFRATGLPALQQEVANRRRTLAELQSGSTNGVAWGEMVNRLAGREEVADWIKALWQARDEALFSDASRVAEFLLLREFARRPRRANSVETLGLARLRHPSIEGLDASRLPDAFRRRGRTIEDWRAYLDFVLTWFVRANGAISITWDLQHWVSSKAKLTSLVGPDAEIADDDRRRGWPNGYWRTSPRSRPVAFLLQGLGLDLANAADRADLDDALRKAWDHVQPVFSSDPERRVFDFSKSCIAPVVEAFYCPVTRRILDRAPFGLTPYGVDEPVPELRHAFSITMPRHPRPMLGLTDLSAAREATREWIAGDAVIGNLRNRGVWRDVSDRIALFADYARSAEHSAQQDSGRLRRYEEDFKAGRINILNCSTTMEMGVDIGSVSSVMMTNVPPSIANYRQRVGRAGRRGQAVALAFTFCKDRPLDREAFRDPQRFLQRILAAPKVALNSRPIVQRHVNAFLLGSFLRERNGNAFKMQVGAFLGCPDNLSERRPARAEQPVEAFIDWLGPETAAAYQPSLAILTRGSILEGDQGLVEDTRKAITRLRDDFVHEWEGLVALAREEDGRPEEAAPRPGRAARSRMAIELRRICKEFLLGGLADRGFLPGHGFPTDVVSFIPGREYRTPEEAAQDGTRQFRTAGPQRSLDLAIRDYAPGSEVVLDGLVHKSAGLTLNWKRPASEDKVAEIQSLGYAWRCDECDATGVRRVGEPDLCAACGAEHPNSREYIRPAGFSVDPRQRAHADTDTLSYVPPEDPRVSARDAAWQSLPLPHLGRYRCSREGLVYYENRGGPGKYGYAVCLQCGRAEIETDTMGLPTLVDHKPLRYRRGVDVCPGNDHPFSIKRNLSLGFAITTDVFELQPQHPLSRAGACALVIALREALAQELGIDADEMGFAVGQSRNALGASTASLFLFDRAAGGAGFAVSLEERMRPVIQRAGEILDCHTPGCERACAACVLTSDAPEAIEDLDRRAALAFLREHLTFPNELAPEDRFTDNAALSLSPLDEIDGELRRSARSVLTIFVPAESTAAAMQDWPLAAQMLLWKMRGHPVRLAVPPAWLAEQSDADKLVIRDFSLQHSATLSEAEAPVFENHAHALAMVGEEGGSCLVWASRETPPRLPGPAWGRSHSLPVARGRMQVTPQFAVVNLDTLIPKAGAQFFEIDSDLDGDLAGFGDRASKIMVQLLKRCGRWPGNGIAQATYRDAFVCSPLVARLLIDTVGALFSKSSAADASLTIETRPPRSDDSRRPPWQISHDWQEADDQRDVIVELGRLKGVRVASVSQRDVPHGRYLDLVFKDGSHARIILDQGFGAWVLPPRVIVRHNFGAGFVDQAQNLMKVNAVLQRRGIGKTYVVVTPAP